MEKSYIVIAMIVSLIMITSVRIIFAYLSKSKYFLVDHAKWVDLHGNILKITDELLSIGALLFSASIIFLLGRVSHGLSLSISIIIVCLFYCMYCWLGIVLRLGNMVYPVNQIKILDEKFINKALLQIYSRLHLADLALGFLTIFVSNMSDNDYIQLSGYFVGILQMIFTYYSKIIRYREHIFSTIIWCIWMIIFQWSLIK
ncbi:hypothetical protein [Facklamia lactis]|uniref:hypothetical protein n=1 Tax=Facklamia lactis TaxID=2749967 RepID=UPI0018CC9AD8|nr:hypothetical protein [Facklamia lactis]MBG9979428.1 hypothetical protein [Facklamia lactis]